MLEHWWEWVVYKWLDWNNWDPCFAKHFISNRQQLLNSSNTLTQHFEHRQHFSLYRYRRYQSDESLTKWDCYRKCFNLYLQPMIPSSWARFHHAKTVLFSLTYTLYCSVCSSSYTQLVDDQHLCCKIPVLYTSIS
jgi:hypothetical protein